MAEQFSEPIPFVADTDRLLRAEEVAPRLGVSPSTVYAMVRTGELVGVHVRTGKQWMVRVRLSDLDAYIAGLPAIKPTVAR